MYFLVPAAAADSNNDNNITAYGGNNNNQHLLKVQNCSRHQGKCFYMYNSTYYSQQFSKWYWWMKKLRLTGAKLVSTLHRMEEWLIPTEGR